MLPIHIFDGTAHYVLVRRPSAGLDEAERVDPMTTRYLLSSAIRRGRADLLRSLAHVLHVSSDDPELIVTRSLAHINTLGGELLLLRVRHVAHIGRVNREREPDAYVPVDNEIETHWIEIELLSDDASKTPIARARYEVTLPNGSLVTGTLDAQGKARLDDIPPGECVVRFPDYDDPDPAGDVELADEAGPAPPPPGTCELARVEVGCQHRQRGHKLSQPAPKSKPDEVTNVLEVVGAAEGEGDRIKITATLAGPRCDVHAVDAIQILRPRPAERLSFAEDFAEFDAYYGPAKYKEWLWPWNAKPVEYQIVQNTCDAGRKHHSVVRVYPDYQAKLEISVALDAADRSGEALAKARSAGHVERRGRPAHTDWSFSISGELSYGARTFSLDASYESKLENLQTINRWVKQAIDAFCHVFRKFFGLDLELLLPNVALSYSGKFVELEKSWRVDREWQLQLSAAPLFGVTLKIDVLELAIRALAAVPGLVVVSKFLLEAKALAKKHDNTLELVIKFTGSVGFELSASKNAGNNKVQTKADGVGELTVGFEATVEVSGTKWLVAFKAGASLTGATGVTVKPGVVREDDGIALTAQLVLQPLSFEWGAYASGKFIWELEAGTSGSHEFWAEKQLLEGKKYIVKDDAA
jgi:hypothetical protein